MDNTATRLLLLQKKVHELKKEVKLLRMGKEKMEEEEEDEEDEKNWEKDDKEGKGNEEAKQKARDEDSSNTESDDPHVICKMGHKYALK